MANSSGLHIFSFEFIRVRHFVDGKINCRTRMFRHIEVRTFNLKSETIILLFIYEFKF
jgi:hypothetical protein